jgi:hypothetical protein
MSDPSASIIGRKSRTFRVQSGRRRAAGLELLQVVLVGFAALDGFTITAQSLEDGDGREREPAVHLQVGPRAAQDLRVSA